MKYISEGRVSLVEINIQGDITFFVTEATKCFNGNSCERADMVFEGDSIVDISSTGE